MTNFSVDDSSVERLLAGRMTPEEAPAALVGVATLFSAAAGEATPTELAGEAQVLTAAMVALSESPWAAPVQSQSRRRRLVSKLVTAKMLTFFAIGALGIGAAAAAVTGALPGVSSDSSQSSPPTSAVQQASQSSVTSHTSVTGNNGTQGRGSNATPPSSPPPTGPANTQAQDGLCQAFVATYKTTDTSVPKYSSTAFKDLIAEHGGPAATNTYCQNLLKQNNAAKPSDNGQSSGANTGSGTGKASDTGRPSSAGSSSNQGHASNATSANSQGLDIGATIANTASNGHSSAGSVNPGAP